MPTSWQDVRTGEPMQARRELARLRFLRRCETFATAKCCCDPSKLTRGNGCTFPQCEWWALQTGEKFECGCFVARLHWSCDPHTCGHIKSVMDNETEFALAQATERAADMLVKEIAEEILSTLDISLAKPMCVIVASKKLEME